MKKLKEDEIDIINNRFSMMDFPNFYKYSDLVEKFYKINHCLISILDYYPDNKKLIKKLNKDIYDIGKVLLFIINDENLPIEYENDYKPPCFKNMFGKDGFLIVDENNKE